MDPAPTRIARYEILGVVGEGGMGRVYRARDTQLGRIVAIKVLPPAFAADFDFLRRFEQEARATAALNHPGVMAVYDAGLHDGSPYIVTELLEGTTLRERMEAERLSVRKAVDFATQMAEALQAAHEHGIVHRDLKPENVFITPQDRVKILDFGLAKVAPSADPDFTCIETQGTLPNTVLGTPSYMPPEQARGQAADHRADFFSLGCILYEMLQGRRAFSGDSMADVLAAVVKESPPPLSSSVERPVPPVVDAIVQRCLNKDPRGRFQSASDLAFALRGLSDPGFVRAAGPEDAHHSPAGLVAHDRSRLWRALAIGGGALAVLAGIGFVSQLLESRPIDPLIEFLVPPPDATEMFAPMPLPGLLPTAPQVGLSPDGRLLAFVTIGPSGIRKLWIRALDNSRPRAIEGTDGVTAWPFWSPDSRYVVIAVPDKRALIKVDALDGTVERLCTLPGDAPAVPFVTGSWAPGGAILFSIGPTGVYRVAASGGSALEATALDGERGDQYHSWPQFLPDSRFLVFVRTNDPETTGMYAGSLETKDLRKVLATSTRAIYADGHLLSTSEDRLIGRSFDTANLRVGDDVKTIVPSVFLGAGRTPGFWVSNGATLAYASGDTRERQFRWIDRDGTALETVGPPGLYVTFDVAGERSSIVVEVSKDVTARFSTLSLFDAARGVLAPLTLGNQNDSDPRFGSNGNLVFARNSPPNPGIMQMNTASGRLTTVMPREGVSVVWLEDWAPDGGSVVYRTSANRDAWQLDIGSSQPRRLTEARESVEQVQLAPGGKWIAFNSPETGRSEVFVSSVPAGRGKRQVSLAGGVQPTWRADGRELYYLDLDGSLHVVDIELNGDSISVGGPRELFRSPLPVVSAVVEQYRPSSDGERFLFCLPLTSVQTEPLRVLLNWPRKLDRTRDGR